MRTPENKLYGLIGKELQHSFSKSYFTEKFEKEEISHSSYELFELQSIDEFPKLLSRKIDLKGLNVTIPYKEEVIPFLTGLSREAKRIGAVNVIKLEKNGNLTGHNTDYQGFRQSLLDFLKNERPDALVLGTGGASKAVQAVLSDLGISHKVVSRSASGADLTYEQLTAATIQSHLLIVNTTPLGTFPNVAELPTIPYEALSSAHFLFDLVYNPEQTAFMKKGKAQGAQTRGGLEMLHKQAECAWEIWQRKR